MISFLEIIDGCIMLQHLCSDQIVKNSLKKLNFQIVAVLNEVLERFATLQNNKTFKLSSGEEFERMWLFNRISGQSTSNGL